MLVSKNQVRYIRARIRPCDVEHATAHVAGLRLLSADGMAFLPLRATPWVDVIVVEPKTGIIVPCALRLAGKKYRTPPLDVFHGEHQREHRYVLRLFPRPTLFGAFVGTFNSPQDYCVAIIDALARIRLANQCTRMDRVVASDSSRRMTKNQSAVSSSF
jgi:hypothetical protein